jgi:hypothetical protein
MMTALERIREFLTANRARAYCDDCLSSLLKINPRQAVQQKTSALAKTYPFQRSSGTCAHCKSVKLVIGMRATAIADKSEKGPISKTVKSLSRTTSDAPIFSEDEVKKVLETWLSARGWSVEIAWAKSRGVDIHARKNDERWIIEVKGGGSLQPMRVNYFLGVLGETLQRMDDPKAAYSIALPDLKQFRNLWSRLPALAKARTQISALFVARDGSVDWVKN